MFNLGYKRIKPKSKQPKIKPAKVRKSKGKPTQEDAAVKTTPETAVVSGEAKAKQKRSLFAWFKRKTVAVKFRFPKTPLFVLMVGDDGAVLLYIKNREVQHRDFIASAASEDLRIFTERFSEDTNAPLVMVVDTMDQTYLPQTLPPVTSLSVGKLIKRRLEREFPDEEIRGALPLGRESKGRKDWHYLIIALEKTPALAQWLDYLDTLPNWLSGIYLIPVEMEMFIRLLDKSLYAGQTYKAPEWQFIVSYNKVSGFRQVILRKGRIALTRVGQPIGELTPEVIAGNIEQEAQNTMEYLKRMGYQAQDELHLYVIASEAINKYIEPERLRVTKAHHLTPHMVGEMLGLAGATQMGDQYGDVVLATVIGAARQHVLKLITKSAQKLDTLFKLKVGQRIAISIFTGALVSYVGSTMYDIKTIINDIDSLETSRNAKQRELDALKAEVAKAPEDIDRITDMVELYELLTKRAAMPLPLIDRLSRVLTDDVRVKGLSWEVVENAAKSTSNKNNNERSGKEKEDEEDTTVMLRLQVQFSKDTDEQKRFIKMAEEWRQKMKAALDAKDVHYLALPGQVKESESFEISLGQATGNAANRFDGTPIDVDVEIETHLKLPEGTVLIEEGNSAGVPAAAKPLTGAAP